MRYVVATNRKSLANRTIMATNDADENSSNKCRRIDSVHVARVSLSRTDLNDNCFIHSLSYLEFDALNSFAICNRCCREVRTDEFATRTFLCLLCVTLLSRMNGMLYSLDTGLI